MPSLLQGQPMPSLPGFRPLEGFHICRWPPEGFHICCKPWRGYAQSIYAIYMDWKRKQHFSKTKIVCHSFFVMLLISNVTTIKTMQSIYAKSCNITLFYRSTWFFGFWRCHCRFFILQFVNKCTCTSVHEGGSKHDLYLQQWCKSKLHPATARTLLPFLHNGALTINSFYCLVFPRIVKMISERWRMHDRRKLRSIEFSIILFWSVCGHFGWTLVLSLVSKCKISQRTVQNIYRITSH